MQVAYKVTVEGTGDITGKIAGRLLSLEITDKAGVSSDRLTLVLDDRDQVLAIPRKGAKIEVSLGYVGQSLVPKGRFVVDEVDVEGPVRRMTIRANAVDMTSGIKAPKERSFDNITFGQLVQTIATENGLKPSIPESLASRKLVHVDQTESDMQLLTRICAEQDATFKVADGRLVVADRAKGKTASGKDMPPARIDAGDCESWTATLTERGKYQAVHAYWQDKGKAERTKVTAGSGEPALTLKNSYLNEDEAKRAANSKLRALNRGTGKVTVSGYVGDPYLTAERLAALTGFRTGVDGGDWVIDEVTHSVGDDGYTNTIQLETK